jgi:hypothetical protein
MERRMEKGLVKHFVDSIFKFLFEGGKACCEEVFTFKDFIVIVSNRNIILDIRKYGRVSCNPPPPGKEGEAWQSIMYCAERRMGKGLIEHFVDSV